MNDFELSDIIKKFQLEMSSVSNKLNLKKMKKKRKHF